ncbi:MAG: hypothetical protein KOO62_04230 [candidate division Zixibacteria bacterium]|nr:hypothetical protein [candidate division Zixibacteria bacterium]
MTTESLALLGRLKSVLLRQRLVRFLAGVFLTAGVLLLIAIGLSFLASISVLPVWLKVTLLSAMGIVALALFIRYAIVRLFGGSVENVAVILEQKNPHLKGRLIAAVQFALGSRFAGYSQELVAVTEQQAIQRAKQIDLGQAVSYRTIWRNGRLFVISALMAIILVATLPGIFRYSLEVYSQPLTEVAPPLGYTLEATPGSVEWVKYRDIEIGATLTGTAFPDEAIIYHRLVGGNWQHNAVNLPSSSGLSSFDSDTVVCKIKLRQVNRSFDYYVEAGRVKTEIQEIDVVDRPRVTDIKLSLFYPKYSGLPPNIINENNGSFSALKGTRLNMVVGTNLPIVEAGLVFEDSSQTPLTVNSRTGEVSLQIDSSLSYHIRLLDHLGEQNPDPIEYYITAIPDEYPSVDVLRPGFDANLSDEMILPLKVRIFDDFGFSTLVKKYTQVTRGRAGEENVIVLHFSDRIKTEGDVEFDWDMDALHLYPGDYVVYHFEIADNDDVSGPKVSRSRQYIARLPSLDELIAQTEGESAQRISRTEQMLKQGKDMSDKLKNMARRIQAQNKSAKKADWQDQKELEALAEKNQELVNNLEKMAEEMEKSVEKMADNATMSRKVIEKLQQIQKLFEDVATPEMKAAQQKLMEAMKNMDRQKVLEAMKDFEMSQEELLKRLERTLALLKKMQVEQKMEAMVRQAEQLLEQQQAQNAKTDSSATEDLPSLSKQEDEIEQGLQSLKNQVEELRELIKQAEMEGSPEAQSFADAVEKTDADENMAQMSDALKQMQKDQAASEGGSAASKLSQMLDQMQQQLMAMTESNDDETTKAIRMAMEDANQLSRDQEQLLKEAARMTAESTLLQEMATSQQDLQKACSGLKKRISELGKESPFIAAELEMLVNQVTENMQQAIDGFTENKTSQACRSQRQAMVDLNRAAVRLLESLDQQKQCDKGGNCDKNMSKLESMCNKQNKLNQKTKGQCNKPSMNPAAQGNAAREGLQRLMGEQQSIRKSMEQLADEFGSSRQVLGRLQDIAREMKEVEEDLADGEIGEQTLQKQLRIYSRMLQASRSLQRKDFTQQRKATAAEEQLFVIPSSLPAELLDSRVKLEDRLRRFLGDSYPPQYEEQIKAYFKALLQTESPDRSTTPAPGAGQ